MDTQIARRFWGERRKLTLGYAALFAGLALLLFLHPGSLPRNYSAVEAGSVQSASSLHAILNNPLHAPYKLLVYVLSLGIHRNFVVARLAAMILGLGTLSIFSLLLHTWYTRRTAVLGTILFGCSAWFWHVARLGTPDVETFGLIALTAAVVWARRTHQPLAWLSCIFLAASLLYVPGMIWFLGIGALWQIRTFGGLAWQRRWVSLAGGALAILGLAPLAWGLTRSPALIKIWLGWPYHWMSLTHTVRSIVAVPFHVVLRGPDDPLRWLGHLPMLDVFASVMLIVGLYTFLAQSRRLAVGFTILLGLSCILIGIGSVPLAILAPGLYVVIAGGIQELSRRWLTVFPRNPIARRVGLGLLTIAVLTTSIYNIRAYFVAWQQAADTHSTFSVENKR